MTITDGAFVITELTEESDGEYMLNDTHYKVTIPFDTLVSVETGRNPDAVELYRDGTPSATVEIAVINEEEDRLSELIE